MAQQWLGGADVSLQCAFELRHRRKTSRLTRMELATYCAQEDSLHLRWLEARRRGRRPLRMAAMVQDRLGGCDVRPGGQRQEDRVDSRRLGIWMPAMFFTKGLDQVALKLVWKVSRQRRPHDTAGEVQERSRATRVGAAARHIREHLHSLRRGQVLERRGGRALQLRQLLRRRPRPAAAWPCPVPVRQHARRRHGSPQATQTPPTSAERGRVPRGLYGRSLRVRSPFMAATSVGGNDSPMTPEDSIVVCTSFMIDELTAVQLPY
ncbi:hypothetical protein CFC21_002251 [Triticum aestivum]|uniref:Uncharacterized protein n=1 Tax=Triticum aestivum TaxID=4565 RepID=A0A3B5Y067_WHEAT|nr:hypothetical protein CFC21_002251 [Triticum aestivum]